MVQRQKGYGFIEIEGQRHIFVHYGTIEGAGFRSLNDGEMVSFEVEQSNSGLQAVHVRKA
jgi:cold shock protein